MTPEPILPSYIDSTMLTTFRSCPRKFFNEFVLGLRPGNGKNIHFHAGGVFAACLERMYRRVYAGMPQDVALADMELFFERIWGDPHIPVNHLGTPTVSKTKDRMWAALEAYIAHWGVLTDPVQPYVIDGKPTFEHRFAVPLDRDTTGLDFPVHPVSGDPFLFAGRFDMLGHMRGLTTIRDEKTTSGIGAGWADQWDLRGQFLGYVWATEAQGIPVGAVVIRGVGVLKTEIKLVESVRQYPRHLVLRWLEQTRLDLWRMVDLFNRGYWDYNFGDACNDFGSCMYVRMCSASDPTPWMNEFTIERWNPLALDPLNPDFEPNKDQANV